MQLTSIQDIATLIESDSNLMDILGCVKKLNLPDSWVGAGFVRNYVWDKLHGFETSPLNDIDVIYFDGNDVAKCSETNYNAKLEAMMPLSIWSCKNQARMHFKNSLKPAKNTEEAISRWVETATAIACRIGANDKVEIIAPHGVEDLLSLIVRPVPMFTDKLDVFNSRIIEKGWQAKWPKLQILQN